MKKQLSVLTLVLLWAGALLAIVAAVSALVYALGPSPPSTITIASGKAGGAYSLYAKEYQALLAQNGIRLNVVETSGSVENLALLQSGAVDLAFVQSGLASTQTDISRLRSLASIYYEPLWVFYRNTENLALLSDFKGKRISIGDRKGGTYAVAATLLALNGVDASNTTLEAMDFDATLAALDAGELDAAFIITSPKSRVFRDLLNKQELKLMNFRRYHAYARNFAFVKDIVIHEGTLDLPRNIPDRDITLLSTLATLVSTDRLHPRIVEQILIRARQIHGKPGLLEAGNEFPASTYLEYPMHDSAANFFYAGPSIVNQYLPFWLVTLIRKVLIVVLPLITILLPMIKMTPVLMRWPVRRRLNHWYGQLERIEGELDAAADKEALRQAQTELHALASDIKANPLPANYRADSYLLRFQVERVGNRVEARLRQ